MVVMNSAQQRRLRRALRKLDHEILVDAHKHREAGEWCQQQFGRRWEVIGHSDAMEDSVGVEKTQYSGMAEKRVDAVIAYLKEKGIDPNRLISVVENSAIPNDEISEADDQDLQMAKNRRVTFRAL